MTGISVPNTGRLRLGLATVVALALAAAVAGWHRTHRPHDPAAELEARVRKGTAAPVDMVRLGEYYLQRGDALKAAAMAFRARQADPGLAEAHHLLGVLYLAGGDEAKARASFAEAVRVAPQNLAARLSLGQFEVDHHRPDAALQQAQAAVNIDHHSAAAWLLAGKVQRLAHGDTAAGTSFRRAASLDPKLAEAQFELGTLALDFDNYAEAVAPLEEAYRLGDRRPVTLACLALAHVAGPGTDADAARARQLLQEAHQPELPPSWFAQGLLLQREHHFGEARQAFEKVLRANPRNERAQYALAMVFRDLRDMPAAEKAMQRHDLLVTQRQRLRQFSQRAAKGERSPSFLRDYGKALLEAEQPQEAARQFRAWRQLAPGDGEATDWLNRAESAAARTDKR